MNLVYLINTWPLISQFQGYLYKGIIKQFLNLDMSITTYYLKEKLIQEIKLFFFVSSTMQMATLLVYIYTHRLGHPEGKLMFLWYAVGQYAIFKGRITIAEEEKTAKTTTVLCLKEIKKRCIFAFAKIDPKLNHQFYEDVENRGLDPKQLCQTLLCKLDFSILKCAFPLRKRYAE